MQGPVYQLAQFIIGILTKHHFGIVQRMFHFTDSVGIIISINVSFGNRLLCSVLLIRIFMNHCLWIATEGKSRFSHIQPVQQVVLYSLHHTSLNVILIHQIYLLAVTEYTDDTTGLIAFAISFLSFCKFIVGISKACPVYKPISIIIIMNIHHRARSGTLVRAFPLLGQTAELIIQIISPFLGSLRPLVAILGEDQLVRVIVCIFHKISPG